MSVCKCVKEPTERGRLSGRALVLCPRGHLSGGGRLSRHQVDIFTTVLSSRTSRVSAMVSVRVSVT